MPKQFVVCGLVFLVSGCARNQHPAAPQEEKPNLPRAATQSGIEGSVKSIRLGRKPGPTYPESGVNLLVCSLEDGKEIVQVTTTQDGRFEIHLKPGRYRIKTKGGAPPENQEKTVVVAPGRLTKVEIVFPILVP